MFKFRLLWWRTAWLQSGGHHALLSHPADPYLVRRAASLSAQGHKRTRAPACCCGLWRSCSAPGGSDRAGRNPWSTFWSSHPSRHTAQGSDCCWCSPELCKYASRPWSGDSCGQFSQRSWQWRRCEWESSRLWKPPRQPGPSGWSAAGSCPSLWSQKADGHS